MRWQLASTLAFTAMSAACYGPNTVDCGGGFFCPEGKVCVGTTSCGEPRLVEQCFGSGKSEFATCNYAPKDGAESPGVCRSGVCAPCNSDLANCGTSNWTPMTFPGTPVDMFSVWVLEPAESTEPVTLAYAGGASGTLLRYNGEAWTSVAAFATSDIAALWGSSESDVFAVGNHALYHYDGVAWSDVTSTLPSGAINLKDITGLSARDVYAVGLTGTVVHFDGSSWSDRTVVGPTWNAVSPLAGGGMVAVSAAGRIRVNDDVPVQLAMPYDTAYLADAFLNGTVPTVVGKPPTVMGGIVPTIFERNSSGGWDQAPQSGIGEVPLTAGWEHFAVGPGGRVVHRSSTEWTLFDVTPSQSNLTAIAGAHREVFVVGGGGALWRYVEP